MPVIALDHARENFTAACRAVDHLKRTRYLEFMKRDDGSAVAIWQRQWAAACARKERALEELRLAKVACPPRSRPVRLR